MAVATIDQSPDSNGNPRLLWVEGDVTQVITNPENFGFSSTSYSIHQAGSNNNITKSLADLNVSGGGTGQSVSVKMLALSTLLGNLRVAQSGTVLTPDVKATYSSVDSDILALAFSILVGQVRLFAATSAYSDNLTDFDLQTQLQETWHEITGFVDNSGVPFAKYSTWIVKPQLAVFEANSHTYFLVNKDDGAGNTLTGLYKSNEFGAIATPVYNPGLDSGAGVIDAVLAGFTILSNYSFIKQAALEVNVRPFITDQLIGEIGIAPDAPCGSLILLKHGISLLAGYAFINRNPYKIYVGLLTEAGGDVKKFMIPAKTDLTDGFLAQENTGAIQGINVAAIIVSKSFDLSDATDLDIALYYELLQIS